MSNLATNIIQSKKETWVVALGGCLSMLVVLYLYFLSASIVHVVMRQEINQTIDEGHTRVAALEQSYMKAQHELSANVANLDGYTKADDKIFLSRVPGTLVLND